MCAPKNPYTFCKICKVRKNEKKTQELSEMQNKFSIPKKLAEVAGIVAIGGKIFFLCSLYSRECL